MPTTHQLNCARLRPWKGRRDYPYPCSCGADPNVHNHGTEDGPGLNCVEYTTPEGILRGSCLDIAEVLAAQEGYVAKMASPRLPQKATIYEVGDDSLPVAPPVASEEPTAPLARWWQEKAGKEAQAVVPKAEEYGGAHRASDLTGLGRTIAELMGADLRSTDHDEGWYQELACYFYIQGKLGRWHAALLEGRTVSDDTIHDVAVYTKMVQRIRDVGGWPV